MKKIIGLLLLQFTVTIALAQKSFEGEVIYSISVKSNTTKLTNEQISSMIGSVQHYYMKGPNYKSLYNGKIAQWAMYRDKDKKYYEKASTHDSIIWRDVSLNHDTITSIKLKKNDTTILGFSCDKLIFFCKNGLQVYYFNSQFAVDPQLYINHQEGCWYAFLQKSRSIALKEILYKPLSYTFTITATSVKRMHVDDKMFELPAGVALIKSRVKL